MRNDHAGPRRQEVSGEPGPREPGAVHRALESLRPYLLRVANAEIDDDLKAKAGASDLVNQTYLEAHLHDDLLQMKSDAEVKSWLVRAFRNNLSNFFRYYRRTDKNNVAREVPLDPPSTGGDGAGRSLCETTLSPSGQAIRNEREAWVNQALGRLKERDRLVLTWRNYENQSWDEIGKRLGGSGDMARKVWTRALFRLREELGPPPETFSDLMERA